MVLNLMIGLITPPVGLCLYTVAQVADVKLGEIISETWPYLIALMGVLLLINFVPPIVMWLPTLFGYA